MERELTLHNVRNHLNSVMREVSETHNPIVIQHAGVVIVNKHDWEAAQETLYLLATGTLAEVQQREQDNSGWRDADDIDWTKV